jgi:hypothetical protein
MCNVRELWTKKLQLIKDIEESRYCSNNGSQKELKGTKNIGNVTLTYSGEIQKQIAACRRFLSERLKKFNYIY